MKSDHIKKLLTFSAIGFGGLSFFNHRIDQLASHHNLLHTENGSFYQWKLGKIYYQKEGHGSKPLLLIHDAAEYASSYEWSLLTRGLRKEYTIYTIDLLGCGRSDKPALTYTNYLYVQMISAFIRDVIGSTVHIAAAGRSASFAVMTAKCEPSLVSQIIMINPLSTAKLCEKPNDSSVLLRRLLSIPVIGHSVYNFAVSHSNINYLLDEKFYFNPFKVQKRTENAYYEAAHKGRGYGRYLMASRLGGFMNWDIRCALKEIDQPITVICSENKSGSKEILASYRAVNSDIRTRVIKASRNLPQMEEPDQLLSFFLEN